MPIRHKISDSARHVIQTLQAAGYEAYVVGGAVRDLLLDLDPKDYDIATSATPEEVKGVFRRRARLIGRRFRLAHVYQGNSIFEVSTFRRQPSAEERKGRPDDDGLMVWRDNVFGSHREDAFRRDFTVNALYFDPSREEGGLVDFTGGGPDLENRIVRAIGDPEERLVEDPVRMLRACKLVGQYGFTLEPGLEAAIRKLADNLRQSSRNRLLEEIYKILLKPHTCATFRACHEVGLLQPLLPELGERWDCSAEGQTVQRLLAARDRAMAAGDLFPSRMTGLATMLLPFVAAEYRAPDSDSPLWDNFGGLDTALGHRIRSFYHPYLLPRYSAAKVRDVLLLLPKMLGGVPLKRLVRHPEYERARDTFMTLILAENLDMRLLERLPRTRQRRGHQR